jgi:hypothetical protein
VVSAADPPRPLISFNITDSVLKSLNQKIHVGIFCDLAKAFDCVNHEILLSKSHYFDIQGATANWFRSYLTGRKRKIEIKSPYATESTYLSWETITHGRFEGFTPVTMKNGVTSQKTPFFIKAWSSTGANFRAFAFYNLYK